ncbi:MAG TPA: ABC transporter permease, partial [Gammaproteobacteria bacterium]|nr:ABC transporter permease [Gammaproteobacteria bacterium]
MLARNRGFAAMALVTLAIGIGAATAMFGFVDAVLLRPLPYTTADRIVRVLETRPSGETAWVSTPDFLDWQAQSTSFAELAAQQTGVVTLAGTEPVPLRVLRVTANFFDVFGVKAALGRTFVPGEDRPGNDRVVVLSHALWQTQFGADPAILNRAIVLDSAPFVVVGVLGPDSGLERGAAQLWHPLALQPATQTRGYRWLSSTFGLLAPGVSPELGRAELAAIGARLASDYPDTNRGWGVAVAAYADAIVGANLKTALLVLLAAVGGLLLICCANVASLVLARAVARDTEVAVRMSLGATPGRIAWQLLCENLVLAAAGSLLGLALAWAAIEAFRRLIPPGTLPSEAVVGLDWRVAAFAAAAAVITAVLFGLAPIARTARTGALRGGRRGASADRRARRWLDVVVVAEVTVSMVLLSSAALLVRSFVGLTAV